ncbi:MAG: phosphatase PAP2 family protein [Fidelibacterota bacterium]|nr:MAG: phosphatase PAP2 family protein [Candidatus Neomarinimicrobiota bacterium]
MTNLKVLLFVGLLLSVAAGREDKARTFTQRVGEGLQYAISAPELRLHWVVTGLGTLAALSQDSRMKQQAVEHGLMPELLADVGDEWGGRVGAIVILPGIYLAERLRGTPGIERLQRLEFTFTSLVVVATITQTLKYTVGRPRPNQQPTPRFPYGHSFPSGHTSHAFGIAEVVRTLYGNGAGAVFYGLAVITGISRIHDNKHYLSDVVAGAGLGIGVVRGFSLAQRSGDEVVSWRVIAAPNGMTIEFDF